MSKSLEPKYRSRSPGQGICQVSTLRRSTLQGLMVVGLIVEEILIDLIELGFNDTSTLVGHFVSSPREREKRDRRDSRRDEREE